ncbi:MAG: hypothetical protein M1822_007314 [Bathelium mastoideum]|nr:MAG: hypothetical protein M1822_007314 [Bathelium mastoideum]
MADAAKKPKPQTGVGRLPGTNTPNTLNTPPAGSTRSPSRNSATPPTGVSATPSRTRPARAANGGVVSAKAAVRKPGGPSSLSNSTSIPDDEAEQDARTETLALVEDLKERLRKAEEASEEYRKQVEVFQARLDESHKEQGRLEDKAHEDEERLEGLTNEKWEVTKQKRELESIYEAERASWMREKEDADAREVDLQKSLQRVRETIAVKEAKTLDVENRPSASRTSSLRSEDRSPNPESGQFAPPLQRSNSSSANSKLVMQKDKIIESLRLELAEAQIKLVEMENRGGGKLREVEKALMETRMANARLMEDNESFQLLLSEKTLNGDFTNGLMSGRSEGHERTPSRDEPSQTGGGSLADELQSVNTESDGGESENEKRLTAELASLRDQNKALTLYINSIIERLLNHKGLESVLDKTPNLLAGPDAASAKFTNTEKDLPPVPPKDKDNITGGSGFLARAKSVMVPKTRDSSASSVNSSALRPRPASVIHSLSSSPQQLPSQLSTNEDPDTAPSIPITRSQSVRDVNHHNRRRTSDWSHAAVVQNMYRGPPPGPQSPTGLASPRNSFFSQRMPSGSSVPTIEEHDSDVAVDATSSSSAAAVRNQALAALEGSSSAPNAGSTLSSLGGSGAEPITSAPRYAGSGSSALRDGSVPREIPMSREASAPGTDAGDGGIGGIPSSPPRSVGSAGEQRAGGGGGGPAVMGGNRMRPLRLVQDKQEQDEKERKAANRGSWMGWFNRGKSDDGSAGQM